MNPIFVQIGIAIATILGSGVVSAFAAHKFTVDRAEREFRRRRLEELYLAVAGYCKLLTTSNLIWPHVMAGEIDYDQALDITLENSNKPGGERYGETADVLVSLYFPSLDEHWKKILSARDEINQIRSEFKGEYKLYGPPQIRFIKPFDEALDRFEELQVQFKNEIVKLACSV